MARNHLLYFGREMTFTDKNGTVYPNSFWKLDDVRINTNRREMLLIYAAWETKEAFDDGAESLMNVGGRREYTFDGEAYDKLIVKFAEAVAGVALAGWNITELTKNIPGEGAEFVSFFANAGNVVAPAEMNSFFNLNQTND